MTPIRNGDVQLAGDIELVVVAPATSARTSADQVYRAMRNVVVGVPAEILGRELPVAGDNPFLHAAQQFGLSFAPIPPIEDQIEEAPEFTEIFKEWRCAGIPVRPHSALVAAQLRDFD